jgi:hypothetical protein
MKETELKQIEEMAKVLCKNSLTEYCASGRCSNPNCLVNAKALEILYLAGYRKQSERYLVKENGDIEPLNKQSEWISVSERLPESGEHCLISCTVKRFDGTHGQYVCVGYYAEKFKHLAYGVDDDCVSEYNEENDEFYISEGWHEVIKNWDDYGFVAIGDFVTHWMPLPTPPKEDKNA